MGRILISAGHTVMDPGAIYRDLREADLTRKIAPKIISHLEAAKAEVKGVPLDLPLLQRIQWINNTGFSEAAGDVCLEIHINDGGSRGVEAWYRGEGGNESHKLAKVVTDTISSETGYPTQGIKSELDHELGSLTFLNRTNTISTLLEALYIDNDEDIAILKDDQKLDELAKAIATGILKYLGKDAEGRDLPADQKPKYDDLKVVKRERPQVVSTVNPDTFTGRQAGRGMGYQGPPAPAGQYAFPATGFPQVQGMPGRQASTSFMADREQRKEIIEKAYVKVLGRKPSPADLNYFLNMGIAEPDLIKKMIDSQEHVDLIKAKQELAELKEKYDKQSQQVTKLESAVGDQKAMLINLNHLLQHKNRAIADLEFAIASQHGMPSGVWKATKSKGNISDAIPGQSEIRPKRSTLEKVFGFISGLFS